MGNYVDHCWGGLRIPAEKEAEALKALVEGLHMFHEGTPLYWGSQGVYGQPPATLAEAMEDVGFGMEDEESGWRVGEDYHWPSAGEEALTLVTPFAEEGDVLGFQDSGGYMWGYLSRGGECIPLVAKIVWHVEGDESDVALED